jgi:3-oxoacyl-[acyl-carrier-protein] synthase-1
MTRQALEHRPLLTLFAIGWYGSPMPHEVPREGYPLTALATANALGMDTRAVHQALRAGRSGLARCRLELPFETSCGALPDELPPPPAALREWDTRLTRMALVTMGELASPMARAVRRWGAERVAVVVGTSTGSMLETEAAYTEWAVRGALPAGFDFVRQHTYHALTDVLRAITGAAGPAWVISTACSSSAKVFGTARRLLRCGLADAVLVGGVDTLCQTTLRGFGSLQALSPVPCRPFSARRDGLSIGEGAGFALVEREGDGPVRLLGVGESSDAYHMSAPHPEGLGARMAMEEALSQAGLTGRDVDHVNAHGTATPANDAIEARAIVAVVGPETPVASTKGYTGHLLGAAGAVEAVLAALCIEHGFVPESLGADPVDPEVPARIARACTARKVRTVLSNSFGFGGSNASLVLGAA